MELLRSTELVYLQELLFSPRAEFTYLRGKRRVGKSWLLSKFAEESRKKGYKVLFISGAPDLTTATALQLCIQELEKCTGEQKFSLYRKSLLSWNLFFEEVHRWAQSLSEGPLIIFDEIQWLARNKGGMVGALKAAWVPLERETKVKIIICGSSERFFSAMTGGEEKILRGMSTRAPLIVPPFSPLIVRKEGLSMP